MIRVISIVVATLLSGYILFASFYFSEERQDTSCQSLQVVVKDSLEKHFISEDDLVGLLKKAQLDPRKQPMKSINTELIEKELLKNEMISDIQAYKTPSGIITLEDILEELVGEIWDEHDEVVEDIRQQSDGSWLIAGGASVDDVAEELDIRDKEEIDAVAIGGLVQEKLSRLPKVGDHFVWGSFDGTVTRATNRRVQEVRLVSRPPEPETKKPDRRDRDKD